MSTAPDPAAFVRALNTYDPAHRDRLVEVITAAMTTESMFITADDKRVLALRTSEMADALAICLAGVLALVPEHDIPSKLRERVDGLAKRIRKQAAQARAEGIADCLGAGKGGHA